MIRFDVPFLKSKDIKGLSDVNYSQYLSELGNVDIIQKYGNQELSRLVDLVKNIDTSIYDRIDEAKSKQTLSNELLGTFLDEIGFKDVQEYIDKISRGNSLKLLDDFLGGGSLNQIISSTSGFSLNSLSQFLSSTSLTNIIDRADNLPGVAGSIKSFVSVSKGQVDSIFSEYTSKLENIESRLQIFKSESTLQGVNKINMTKVVSDKLTNMKTLLTNEKKEEVKEKIDERASRSVGNLNEIKPNDVNYARGLISGIPEGIKEFFEERWNDVKQTIESLEQSKSDAKTKSDDVLKESVEAGRPAVDPNIIKANCADYGSSYNNEVDRQGSDRNFDKRKNLDVPSSHPPPSSWSNLSFVVGNVLKMTTKGTPVTAWGYHPDVGYYRCNLEVLTMANEVGKMIGKKITVSSAYRPPEYNRSVGGASRSQHLKGNALDCLMGGINRNDFVAAAKAVGFRGIGYYNSFIHIDIGPARSWRG